MNKSSNSNLKPFTPEYWEESYRSEEMGWDLGGPTPIFDQWIGTCKEQLVICILGAGNGWDAINFARRGHIVTAVDFAKLATTNMLIAAKNNHVEMDIRHMDIFDLNQIYENHFDVVLEYTCYCAIDPNRRSDYLKMVYKILKPEGEFVGLLFPTDKDPSEGGPPFAVQLGPTIELISEYFSLIKQEIPSLSVKPRSGRELFIIFQKSKNPQVS